MSINRAVTPSRLYPNGVPVFDPSFDPRKPEVQMFLYEACKKFHNGTGLAWRGTARDGVDWCVHQHTGINKLYFRASLQKWNLSCVFLGCRFSAMLCVNARCFMDYFRQYVTSGGIGKTFPVDAADFDDLVHR